MDQVLAVLAQTMDGVYALDQTQRIVFWNTAAERILGYRVEEVIGHPCHEVFDGAPRPGCLECQAGCSVKADAPQRAGVAPHRFVKILRTRENTHSVEVYFNAPDGNDIEVNYAAPGGYRRSWEGKYAKKLEEVTA